MKTIILLFCIGALYAAEFSRSDLQAAIDAAIEKTVTNGQKTINKSKRGIYYTPGGMSFPSSPSIQVSPAVLSTFPVYPGSPSYGHHPSTPSYPSYPSSPSYPSYPSSPSSPSFPSSFPPIPPSSSFPSSAFPSSSFPSSSFPSSFPPSFTSIPASFPPSFTTFPSSSIPAVNPSYVPPPPAPFEQRCGDNNEAIQACDSCALTTSTWYNEITTTDESTFDFDLYLTQTTVLSFSDVDNDVEVKTTTKVFITEETADMWDDLIERTSDEDQDCVTPDHKEPLYEVTSKNKGRFNFQDCVLYLCELDDHYCEITGSYQTNICGQQSADTDHYFASFTKCSNYLFSGAYKVDLRDDCGVLDLLPDISDMDGSDQEDNQYLFLKGSAGALVTVSFTLLALSMALNAFFTV